MSDKVAVRTHAGVKHVWYFCPGCQQLHGVPAERWHWNGSLDNPTLSPSVRHFYMNKEKEVTHCHYRLVNGKLEYCSDCAHDLKGQVVELQAPMDVPDDS